MTDFLAYAKAMSLTSLGAFAVSWCVVGLKDAILTCAATLVSLLVLTAIVCSSLSLTYLFLDWYKKNEKTNTAERPRDAAETRIALDG